MNFKEDLRKQLILFLRNEKINFNLQSPLNEFLMSYLNFRNRSIEKNIKRKVFVSDNVSAITDNKIIEIVHKFKKEFENGEDMNGYLSKGVFYSNFGIKDKELLEYKKSRDFLLDDWGIHHLHLSNKKAKNKKDMSKNRSPYLLFVKITHDKVYFIDVLEHKSKNFLEKSLLETIDRNWSFLLKPYLIPKLMSAQPSNKFTINNYRKNHNYYLNNINGKVYLPPGGGLNTFGTNIMIVEEIDSIIQDIEDIENYVSNNILTIKKEIESLIKKNVDSESLLFEFAMQDTFYIVKELTYNIGIGFFFENKQFIIKYGFIKK